MSHAQALPEKTLVLRPPSPDKPGYVRRMRKAIELQHRWRTEKSLEAFDAMLDFTLANATIVEAPEGMDVREAFYDLSEAEFDAIFSSITGSSKTSTAGNVPSQNGGQ